MNRQDLLRGQQRFLVQARVAAVGSDCTWYSIKNQIETEELDVYIYDFIGDYGVSAQMFVRDLNEFKAGKINLHLNTPGGNVFDGVTIYNALRDYDAPVTAIVDGIAASAGSFILQAGDTRVMNRSSQLFIHDAHGVAIGNARDMRDMADTLEKTNDQIAAIYADKSGGSIEDWRKVMTEEKLYSAQEAVADGLADEAVADDSDEPSNKAAPLTTARASSEPATPSSLFDTLKGMWANA